MTPSVMVHAFVFALALVHYSAAYTKPLFIRAKLRHLLSSGKEEEENANAMSRPPVIPFDFAREDMPDAKTTQIMKDIEKNKLLAASREERRAEAIELEQPTGYANDMDESDNDTTWIPSAKKDDSLKFLKDVYIVKIRLHYNNTLCVATHPLAF